MSDPVDHLTRFAEQSDPVTPLAAAEVRARGDRLRRRHTGLAVATGIAAVALVALPVAWGFGGHDRAHLPPSGPSTTVAPTPSAPQTATPEPGPTSGIPADFPIDAGLSDADTTRTAVIADRLEFCGTKPLRSVTDRDSISADLSGGETSEVRTLVLLPTVARASSARRAVLAAAGACGHDTTHSPASDVAVLPADPDWPGSVVQVSYGPRDTVYVTLVQKGAALLVTSSYVAGDPARGLAGEKEALAPVVAAMTRLGGTRTASDADSGVGSLAAAVCRLTASGC